MASTKKQRIWAAAKIAGLVTLAVRAGDRALLVEVDEDAEVVRLCLRQATAEGWVTVSEQTTDTLCRLEVLEELPLLEDRPGLARCAGFGASSVDSDSEAA